MFRTSLSSCLNPFGAQSFNQLDGSNNLMLLFNYSNSFNRPTLYKIDNAPEPADKDL